MRSPLLAIFTATTALLSGCISVPPDEADAPVRVGNAPSSVVDLKAARAAVHIVETAPPNAQSLGEVKAIRCHRYPGEPKPTMETVQDDLLIAAFANSANAITDVSIERQPGNVSYNCWFRYFGRAKSLNIPAQ